MKAPVAIVDTGLSFTGTQKSFWITR